MIKAPMGLVEKSPKREENHGVTTPPLPSPRQTPTKFEVLEGEMVRSGEEEGGGREVTTLPPLLLSLPPPLPFLKDGAGREG